MFIYLKCLSLMTFEIFSPCFQFDQLTRARVNLNISSVMYGQWSDDGEAIFATRSRTSPILYDVCFIKIFFTLKFF